MNKHEFQEADQLVRRRVATSARRYWWADQEDMRQNGWRILLEADRTFDPARGTQKVYRNSAMLKGLWVQMLRDSSPVSASDHSVPKMAQAGCIRAPIDSVESHAAPDVSLEDSDHRAWRLRLSALLALVADSVPDGPLGLSVLLGADPRAVARHYGVKVERVKQARTLVRRALKKHPDAQVLHMQLRNSG